MFFLRSITQELVIIDPPEKLVIEVDSAGAYRKLGWARNSVGFSLAPGAVFPATSERFFYFSNAYVREPTAEEDFGLYDVNLVGFGGENRTNSPNQSFTVVPYGKPNTVAVYSFCSLKGLQ